MSFKPWRNDHCAADVALPVLDVDFRLTITDLQVAALEVCGLTDPQTRTGREIDYCPVADPGHPAPAQVGLVMLPGSLADEFDFRLAEILDRVRRNGFSLLPSLPCQYPRKLDDLGCLHLHSSLPQNVLLNNRPVWNVKKSMFPMPQLILNAPFQ